MKCHQFNDFRFDLIKCKKLATQLAMVHESFGQNILHSITAATNFIQDQNYITLAFHHDVLRTQKSKLTSRTLDLRVTYITMTVHRNKPLANR